MRGFHNVPLILMGLADCEGSSSVAELLMKLVVVVAFSEKVPFQVASKIVPRTGFFSSGMSGACRRGGGVLVSGRMDMPMEGRLAFTGRVACVPSQVKRFFIFPEGPQDITLWNAFLFRETS